MQFILYFVKHTETAQPEGIRNAEGEMVDKQSSKEGEMSCMDQISIELYVLQICTNEDEDTGNGGISINNIGGVFIIIFGGIFLAVLTLTLEFTILKFGWSSSCYGTKPVNEPKIRRWEINFN